MTHNTSSFHKLLIVLAFIGVFLLGSIMNIKFTSSVIIFLIALTLGLLIGYAIGTGKNICFWKDNTKKK